MAEVILCLWKALSLVGLFAYKAPLICPSQSPTGDTLSGGNSVFPISTDCHTLVHDCLVSVGEVRNGGGEAGPRQRATGLGDLGALG